MTVIMLMYCGERGGGGREVRREGGREAEREGIMIEGRRVTERKGEGRKVLQTTDEIKINCMRDTKEGGNARDDAGSTPPCDSYA